MSQHIHCDKKGCEVQATLEDDGSFGTFETLGDYDLCGIHYTYFTQWMNGGVIGEEKETDNG